MEFILDLGLIYDILQELSKLSLNLQERNIDLSKGHIILLVFVAKVKHFQMIIAV